MTLRWLILRAFAGCVASLHVWMTLGLLTTSRLAILIRSCCRRIVRAIVVAVMPRVGVLRRSVEWRSDDEYPRRTLRGVGSSS